MRIEAQYTEGGRSYAYDVPEHIGSVEVGDRVAVAPTVVGHDRATVTKVGSDYTGPCSFIIAKLDKNDD